MCLQILVQALVISRLDYCNSVLVNLPDSTLHPYTTILHSAARLAKGLKPRDHITPALRQLHWLPIKARIIYKICFMMFNINSGSSPRYMSSLVTPCNQIQSRTNLRSSTKGDYVITLNPKATADHSNTRPTSLLSRWSVRVEQTTDYRPWSAIYFIFQIQT